LALLALAGCKREATGQVAAVVNGDEITLQELNQEIGNDQLPKNVDRKAIQQAALQKIIDRRLVSQVARDEGIDKQPEYITRQRQMNELLLIQMFGQKLGRAARMPDTAEIDKFMAAHPATFGQRTVYQLDRVQFPMPANPQSLQSLKDDHTMAAVMTRLTSLGINFKRSPGELDTAVVPPQIMARIKALPPGEPFVLPEGKTLIVSAVTGSQPQPLVGAQARPIAVEQMRAENLRNTMGERLKTARASAKIEYQAGFAPPGKPAAPGAAPKEAAR
jgi:EpsD family peptidyl-prolyl cis-trans isomerase